MMMMKEVRIEIITGLLETFPNLREKVSNHTHTSWNFEDYLVASGIAIEPDDEPDYRDIINKFKASLKNNARVWYSMYIENRVPDLHSAEGWKTVKSKFLTYFNQ